MGKSMVCRNKGKEWRHSTVRHGTSFQVNSEYRVHLTVHLVTNVVAQLEFRYLGKSRSTASDLFTVALGYYVSDVYIIAQTIDIDDRMLVSRPGSLQYRVAYFPSNQLYIAFIPTQV